MEEAEDQEEAEEEGEADQEEESDESEEEEESEESLEVPIAPKELPKRATRGLRMNALVGKALEED